MRHVKFSKLLGTGWINSTGKRQEKNGVAPAAGCVRAWLCLVPSRELRRERGEGIMLGLGSGSHGSYHTESCRHGDERRGWPGMVRYSGPAVSTSPDLFLSDDDGAAPRPTLASPGLAEWKEASVL